MQTQVNCAHVSFQLADASKRRFHQETLGGEPWVGGGLARLMHSVGMIARIIAILASDGFTVEAAKFGIKHRPSCNVGLCLLVLVCISICFVMITCPSTTVLAQFDPRRTWERK